MKMPSFICTRLRVCPGQQRSWRVEIGALLVSLFTLASSPAWSAPIDHFFAKSPVFKFDRETTLATLKRKYPDLAYDAISVTHITQRTGSKLVQSIAFSVYEDKLTSSKILLNKNVSSAAAIAAAARRQGYNLISERDVNVVGNHPNGSTLEASTSRREVQWRVVVGPRDAEARTAAIAAPASAAPAGALSGDSDEAALSRHLAWFLDNAPLMQFTQGTPLAQIRQHYPDVSLMEDTAQDYQAFKTSTPFVERVEFHTENDGKRLTWIGVYFKPGLDQKAMAATFSSVLTSHYGELLRDTASEHLVRRADFTNAFHTRWYFRQKQWGAGIYPPK